MQKILSYTPTVAVCLILLTATMFSQSFTDPPVISQSLFLQFSVILMVLSYFLFALGKAKTKISVNWLDIAMIVFALYTCISFFYGGGAVGSQLPINTSCLFVVYLIAKTISCDTKKEFYVKLIFLALGLYEVTLGGYQMLSGSPFSGSWINSGVYAIWLAAIAPFVLHVAVASSAKWAKITSMLLLIGILVLIILKESRTAWLSAGIGGLIVLNHHFRLLYRLKGFFDTQWKRLASTLLLIAVVAMGAISLYQYKRGSSIGRIYIYEHCMSIIYQNPILGVGLDRFIIAMSDQQAQRLSNKLVLTEYDYAAGEIEYAFNEFLHLTVEQGLVGLGIFLFIVIFLIQGWYHIKEGEISHNMIGYYGVFTAILVSSLFSYPLHEPGIAALFYFVLGTLSATLFENKVSFVWSGLSRRLFLVVLVLGCVLAFYHRFQYLSAELTWAKAFKNLHQSENGDRYLEDYRDIYPVLKTNRYFLFNYGAELSVRGQLEDGIEILHEAEKHLNYERVALFLGETYWKLGDIENAEKYLLRAMHLMPYKFFTRFQLVNLLVGIKRQDEALQLAKSTLAIKPKFDQELVKEVKRALKEFIEESESQASGGNPATSD